MNIIKSAIAVISHTVLILSLDRNIDADANTIVLTTEAMQSQMPELTANV